MWGGAQVANVEDEQSLIARAQTGDRSAYASLLEPSIRVATRFAFALLRDRTEAEDAFQEAALRAWRRLENLHAGSRFQPWFIGIVANQCREMRRGRWWQLIRVPQIIRAERADEIATWVEGEDLRRAVARLPHDQRVAVLLHFHLDMPLSEVAIALGISQAGVKTRINRALKRLRSSAGPAEVKLDV